MCCVVVLSVSTSSSCCAPRTIACLALLAAFTGTVGIDRANLTLDSSGRRQHNSGHGTRGRGKDE